MDHDLSAYERAAAFLDGHAGYRVLRALPPPARYPVVEPEGLVRTAVVIDVETIGLDPDHPIIDLAMSDSGSRILACRSRPRSPG